MKNKFNHAVVTILAFLCWLIGAVVFVALIYGLVWLVCTAAASAFGW